MQHISTKSRISNFMIPGPRWVYLTRSFPDYINERVCFIILNAAKTLCDSSRLWGSWRRRPSREPWRRLVSWSWLTREEVVAAARVDILVRLSMLSLKTNKAENWKLRVPRGRTGAGWFEGRSGFGKQEEKERKKWRRKKGKENKEIEKSYYHFTFLMFGVTINFSP